MKLLSLLFVFVPFIICTMDPSKFTPEQVEAFKKGEQISEQESADFISNNKNEFFNLFSNLALVKEGLKQQLGQQKYNALRAAWNVDTFIELSQECLAKERPFEFNKKTRALITDQEVTTYLADGPVTLTLVQFQAIAIPDFAEVSVAITPYPARAQETKQKSKSLFSRLKECITKK